MIKGIHHTAISTGDFERSLRFYRDLLGFEVVYSSSWEKGTETTDRIVGLKDSAARIAMLKAGNACIELFQYSSPTPKPAEPMRPVCDHGITRGAQELLFRTQGSWRGSRSADGPHQPEEHLFPRPRRQCRRAPRGNRREEPDRAGSLIRVAAAASRID